MRLDISNTYNLIRIKKGHEYLIAFDTRYGKFEYTVVPFGLVKAMSCIFQIYEPGLFRFH